MKRSRTIFRPELPGYLGLIAGISVLTVGMKLLCIEEKRTDAAAQMVLECFSGSGGNPYEDGILKVPCREEKIFRELTERYQISVEKVGSRLFIRLWPRDCRAAETYVSLRLPERLVSLR